MSEKYRMTFTDVEDLSEAELLKLMRENLTLYSRKLKRLLVQNNDKTFLVDEINEAEVDKSHKKLRKSCSSFLDK